MEATKDRSETASDWLDFFFKITSYFLYDHYHSTHFKPPRNLKHKIKNASYKFGLWVFLGIVYCLIFYVFIIEVKDSTGKTKEIFTKVLDFVNVPFKDIALIVYKNLYDSIWSNTFFLYLFYKSVSSNAERDFFRDHFVHHKISGLIKVIKIGEFDTQSRYSEQNDDLVDLGRKHFHDLVSDEKHELVTIVTSSGWDFFGTSTDPKSDKKLKYKDGYLLEFLSMRNKRFEIMFLDPDSESTASRASSYMEEKSHNVIENIEQYKDGIRICLKNIAEAAKDNNHVIVKLMSNEPAWKILKVDGEVWTQPIISGFRSDHTMLYGYKNKPQSVYHFYFNTIEDLWKNSKQIDLSKYRVVSEEDQVEQR